MSTILVVDDEIGIRELLADVLADEGYVVELAEDAKSARSALLRVMPNLVLLDIWMPDTDGITLLKEWQSQGQLSMPVIMMSGHATIDTAVAATKIGAVNFLEKPISLAKLLAAVKEAFAKSARTVLHKNNPQFASTSAPHVLRATSTSGALDTSAPMPFESGTRTSKMPSNEVVNKLATSDLLAAQNIAASSPFAALASASAHATLSLGQPLRDARDAFERAYFEHHLNLAAGSMTRVAENTGLERTHLYRKLKQLGLDVGKAAYAQAIQNAQALHTNGVNDINKKKTEHVMSSALATVEIIESSVLSK